MVDFKKLLEDSRGKPGNLNNYVERTEQSKARHNIENRSKTHPTVSVTVAGADYAIKFGYDAALLKKLKDAVPESERTWHKGRKVWLVSPEGIENAIQAINQRIGQTIKIEGKESRLMARSTGNGPLNFPKMFYVASSREGKSIKSPMGCRRFIELSVFLNQSCLKRSRRLISASQDNGIPMFAKKTTPLRCFARSMKLTWF